MGKENPAWRREVREFCLAAGIDIVAIGPDLLVVEARSEDRVKEIASQLGQLGFTSIKDEDDANAGLLSLSKNPGAVQAKIAQFDISRRRLGEMIEPLICALPFFVLVASRQIKSGMGRYEHWITSSLSVLAAVFFVWDGARIWGWRIEILPDSLRVRRYWRWNTIPWEQILGVQSTPAIGRNKEAVFLDLTAGASERLGSFNYAFARNLRDRLRIEVAHRRG
jgi:hypothetical protein